MGSPELPEGAYGVAHPRPVAVHDLARAMALALRVPLRPFALPAPVARWSVTLGMGASRLLGVPAPVDRATLDLLRRSEVVDPGPLSEACGWRARVDLLRGLAPALGVERLPAAAPGGGGEAPRSGSGASDPPRRPARPFPGLSSRR